MLRAVKWSVYILQVPSRLALFIPPTVILTWETFILCVSWQSLLCVHFSWQSHSSLDISSCCSSTMDGTELYSFFYICQQIIHLFHWLAGCIINAVRYNRAIAFYFLNIVPKRLKITRNQTTGYFIRHNIVAWFLYHTHSCIFMCHQFQIIRVQYSI